MLSPQTFIIVLDGAADRPIARLKGDTPLGAATTPHLNQLASESRMCSAEVIGKGFWPESDSGAMALLGYDPKTYYTGRGPLEGLGAGLIRNDGRSIAFRANFGSFDEAANRLDRRTARGLSDLELQDLTEEVRNGVSLRDFGAFDFEIVSFSRHRAILGFSSEHFELGGRVTNTDPGFESVGYFGRPVSPYEPRPSVCVAQSLDDDAARLSAELVNAFVERSGDVLRRSDVNRDRVRRGQLPANVLLIRDGGDPPVALPQFEQRFGRSLAMFGQIFAERGLASLIGASFDFSRLQDGEDEAEYLNRAAHEFLTTGADVTFCHLKGPDEPGHDNDPDAKVRAIEAIDAHFVGRVLETLDASANVVVCCDHSTPCELGIHSDDPVPIMVRQASSASDGLQRFSESCAAMGTLPVRRACELLPFLFDVRE